jgi:hypothetical protein
MEGTGSEDLVFVVVGNGNQKLRVTVVHGWSEIVSVLEREIIGIASGSGI